MFRFFRYEQSDTFTNLMANVCTQCFMATCPHAANDAVACTAFTPAPNGARLANGNYEATFRNTLPLEVRNLDGAHIDNLVGGVQVVNPVVNLTAAEQGIFDDVNTITAANLGTWVLLGLLQIRGRRSGLSLLTNYQSISH